MPKLQYVNNIFKRLQKAQTRSNIATNTTAVFGTKGIKRHYNTDTSVENNTNENNTNENNLKNDPENGSTSVTQPKQSIDDDLLDYFEEYIRDVRRNGGL